ARINANYRTHIADYASLYRWSTEYLEAFWTEVWRFCGVRADQEWTHVLENGDKMPGAKWFIGSRLNFAENLLWRNDDAPALIFCNERNDRRELSFRQLRNEVARVAAGLKSCGVVSGDRVVGFMPNVPEALIAMLATASIGATWSSCSPDFGVAGVFDRFGQIAPKVLFTADGYFYGGKTIDSLPTAKEIVARIPSIEKVVVVPYVNAQPALDSFKHAIYFNEFGKRDSELKFASLPFDHPLYILYSSGTTGIPKCIVHGAGGVLLQHLKEHVLHVDLRSDDRMFYFTTCGWMMWNWLVSGLAVGATLILYDGSPFHPDPRVLWRMAERERVDIFGTSPRFLASCEKENVHPAAEFNLPKLRTILSTGSPLSPESFRYVYEHVKKDLQLASISGGTDLAACFAQGCPTQPVYEGVIQCRALGMKVEIYDEDGYMLEGEKGELVCTKPFPSMPIGFWNDAGGKKYHDAYFARFPNVWHHGDYAELTPRGGVIIYGRSDAVLNPSGVRIGTAEIYRQVDALEEVAESLAIGQDWQNDVRVVLFVRLRPGLVLDDLLQKKIRDAIRKNTTPRHVPTKIVHVPDLPRTISGKLVELAVRNVVHGKPVKNVDALANPDALEYFRDRPELKS
ncbi:MAG TPA: acetoacetate--CoA ligase, partial [Steroidobacteraceae bacterium]|nr:acetoacetate--CoA ligase [Steroidobacteraceae bacterium]